MFLYWQSWRSSLSIQGVCSGRKRCTVPIGIGRGSSSRDRQRRLLTHTHWALYRLTPFHTYLTHTLHRCRLLRSLIPSPPALSFSPPLSPSCQLTLLSFTRWFLLSSVYSSSLRFPLLMVFFFFLAQGHKQVKYNSHIPLPPERGLYFTVRLHVRGSLNVTPTCLCRGVDLHLIKCSLFSHRAQRVFEDLLSNSLYRVYNLRRFIREREQNMFEWKSLCKSGEKERVGQIHGHRASLEP